MSNELVVQITHKKFFLPTVVGGKGSALSELMGNGFNVPDGFIVTIPAVQKLIESQPGIEDVRRADREYRSLLEKSVKEHAKFLRDFLSQMKCPDWFFGALNENLDLLNTDLHAIRSSAAMEDGTELSWAGMFDSYLEVNRDSVFRYICKCCASYFSDRSISYRGDLVPEIGDVDFAVIVQKTVPASVSCVVFSEDPANPTSVRIEAVSGFGVSLVGGQITPDSYLLDRTSGVLIEQNLRPEETNTLLSVSLLSNIYDVAMGVEAAFGFSVDIELSIVGLDVFVLQARRITSQLSEPKGANSVNTQPSIADYELTFKVQGLDFLFSDMLADGFGYLNPLFTCVDGEFCQYFPREKMHWAALEGYRWLSDASGFDEYESSYYEFNKTVRDQLSELTSDVIGERALKKIFSLFASIMSRYSRMDFQFTNLVWNYAEADETIGSNLDKLAKFKDVARAWLNEILLDEKGYYAKTVESLAVSLKRNPDDIVNMMVKELALELRSGARVDPSLIEARKKSYAIYVTNGQVNYINDADLIAERYASNSDLFGSGRKLFGQIANRTKDEIKGEVRVVNVDYANPDKMQFDMDNMIAGEILVSEFTAPELMPACRKAIAIVTDLGGMLSHAAIVSRELGIPCLIGTGRAASVYRTGDNATIDFSASCIYPTLISESEDG